MSFYFSELPLDLFRYYLRLHRPDFSMKVFLIATSLFCDMEKTPIRKTWSMYEWQCQFPETDC